MNGINFEIEDLVIPNINALLSHQELQARLVLMDKIIENGEISTSDLGGICVTHTDLVGEVNWAGTC